MLCSLYISSFGGVEESFPTSKQDLVFTTVEVCWAHTLLPWADTCCPTICYAFHKILVGQSSIALTIFSTPQVTPPTLPHAIPSKRPDRSNTGFPLLLSHLCQVDNPCLVRDHAFQKTTSGPLTCCASSRHPPAQLEAITERRSGRSLVQGPPPLPSLLQQDTPAEGQGSPDRLSCRPTQVFLTQAGSLCFLKGFGGGCSVAEVHWCM